FTSAPVAGIVPPFLITVAAIATAKVSDRCSGTVDRKASSGTSPDPLPARSFHTPQPLGASGPAEQEDPLRSPVPHQCRHPSGSRSQSETPRRRDWLLHRVTHVE